MSDNVLAYSCPFFKILGWKNAIGLEHMLVFYGNSETKIRLASDLYQSLYDFVGKCKIIRRRIGFIRIKIAKQIRNIDVKSAT